jgi:hypothetical protein
METKQALETFGFSAIIICGSLLIIILALALTLVAKLYKIKLLKLKLESQKAEMRQQRLSLKLLESMFINSRFINSSGWLNLHALADMTFNSLEYFSAHITEFYRKKLHESNAQSIGDWVLILRGGETKEWREKSDFLLHWLGECLVGLSPERLADIFIDAIISSHEAADPLDRNKEALDFLLYTINRKGSTDTRKYFFFAVQQKVERIVDGSEVSEDIQIVLQSESSKLRSE